jgi:predicted esterase
MVRQNFTIGVDDHSTLHLPRILCLHGGGSNAEIFRMQCRAIEASLQSQFRFCYAEAPFPSPAGPDILLVYKEYGPFRRWLLSTNPNDQEAETEDTLATLEKSLAATMHSDDLQGATGSWVGILGFSQGAKVAASMFLYQQTQVEISEAKEAIPKFRFAVLMAGRAPISMDRKLYTVPRVADNPDDPIPGSRNFHSEKIIEGPTIHMHGLQDLGLKFHRIWVNKCCKEGSTTVIEWEGNHRLPIKPKDVSLVVHAINEAIKW